MLCPELKLSTTNAHSFLQVTDADSRALASLQQNVLDALRMSPSFAERSAFVFCDFQPRQELLARPENDFLVVLPGVIIGIECKITLNEDQLKNTREFWGQPKHLLGEEIGADTEFVKCLVYHDIDRDYEESESCENCADYFLRFGNQGEFLRRFLGLLEKIPKVPESQVAAASFRTTVRDLLLFTSRREARVGVTRLADAFAQMPVNFVQTDAKKMFVWHPDQYAVASSEKRFAKITGGKRSP